MKNYRKLAKAYIKNATKIQYADIVDKAFLTVRQNKILLMKRTDEQIANWQIGNLLNVSVDTVNKEFLVIYDKIARALNEH